MSKILLDQDVLDGVSEKGAENTDNTKELRFLVTQKYNFDCIFCHKEGVCTNKDDLLTPNDMLFVFKVCKENFGWNTTTVSGGEPLCRQDIGDILQLLRNEGAKTTLVTNGRLINNKLMIGKLVNRFNISLHSLDKNTYRYLVGKDCMNIVINGIKSLRSKFPEVAIRLNTTIIDGVNSTENNVYALIKFAKEVKASIKFIECLSERRYPVMSLKKIAHILQENDFAVTSENVIRTTISDGETEIILANFLCSLPKEKRSAELHNSLFITQDGKIKPCMQSNCEIDILNEIQLHDEKKLVEKLKRAINCLGKNCNQQ